MLATAPRMNAAPSASHVIQRTLSQSLAAATRASHRMPPASSIPSRMHSMSSYTSELGLGVSSSNPIADESSAELLAQAATFQLHFHGSPQLLHALAAASMVLGLTLLFLGVRLFRPLLFLCAWLFLGSVTYVACMLISHGDGVASLVAGLVVGLALAALVVKVWRLSLFLAGGLCGFVGWIIFQSLFPAAFSSDAGRYCALGAAVLVCGLLATRLEKPALLVCTPVLGAFLLLQGVEHFAKVGLGAFALLSEQGRRQCEGRAACFGLYAALVVLSAAGMFVQWRYTGPWARGRSDKESVSKDKLPAKSGVARGEMIVLASPTKVKESGSDDEESSMSLNPFASPVSTSKSSVGGSRSGTRRSAFGNPFSSPSPKARKVMYTGGYGTHVPQSEYFEGTTYS